MPKAVIPRPGVAPNDGAQPIPIEGPNPEANSSPIWVVRTERVVNITSPIKSMNVPRGRGARGGVPCRKATASAGQEQNQQIEQRTHEIYRT